MASGSIVFIGPDAGRADGNEAQVCARSRDADAAVAVVNKTGEFERRGAAGETGRGHSALQLSVPYLSVAIIMPRCPAFFFSLSVVK